MWNKKMTVSAEKSSGVYLTGFFLTLASFFAITAYDFKGAPAPVVTPPSPAVFRQAQEPVVSLSPRARSVQEALSEGRLKLRPARFYETLEKSKT